jgi:hypothetical protein
MCNDNLASSIATAHRLGADVTLLLGYKHRARLRRRAVCQQGARSGRALRRAHRRVGRCRRHPHAGHGCARSCRRSSRRSATRAAGVQHPLPDRARTLARDRGRGARRRQHPDGCRPHGQRQLAAGRPDDRAQPARDRLRRRCRRWPARRGGEYFGALADRSGNRSGCLPSTSPATTSPSTPVAR